MLFKKVVRCFEELEKTSSSNQMIEILADLFKQTAKEDIDVVAYLTLGSIASAYEDINLGMAEKMVLKAIAAASKKEESDVLKLFKKTGDVGLTAEELVQGRGQLKVHGVFNQLHKIAEASGTGSQEVKIKILSDLLKKSTPPEARFLARIVLGTLRMGVGDMTVLNALAIAFTGSKAHKSKLEFAYNICPDVGIIAKTMAYKGLKGIEKIEVVVGRPIKMMLAQRVKAIEEILEKMPQLAAEEKYDGERIQAHKSKGQLMLYSRRLENITAQFPDVVEQLNKNIKAKEFVIEGEVVPVDAKGNLLPFQVLMQRRRKYEVEKYVKKIPICFYLFDLLYLNGQSFIHQTYPERHQALEKILKPTKSLQLAKRIVTDNAEDIEDFFNKTVERGGEGIVAKSLAKGSIYQTGTRGWLWIKWKREYAKELRDTFDLVIVGAFMGKGMRSGAYGSLLCAAYNDKKDIFETLCKLGSGFTEAQLNELPKKLKPYQIPHKPARLEAHKNMKPDVWFEPEIVVEVLGAELTKSPVHTCAAKEGQGLALRFPRFIKYRSDKKPEQATTSQEIEKMFKG